MQNNSDKEVKIKISTSWKKFWSVCFIVLDKSQKLEIKSDIRLVHSPSIIVRIPNMDTSKRKMKREVLQITLQEHARNADIRKSIQMESHN